MTNHQANRTGTFRWFIGTILKSIGGGLLELIFFVPAALVTSVVLGETLPAAEPFVWIIVAALIIQITGRMDEEDVNSSVDIAERLQEQTRREKFVYLGSLFAVAFGAIGAHIIGLSMISYLFATATNSVILGIVVATAGSVLDGMAGRKSSAMLQKRFNWWGGISLASCGMYAAYIVITALVVIQNVQTDVAQQAARDIGIVLN